MVRAAGGFDGGRLNGRRRAQIGAAKEETRWSSTRWLMRRDRQRGIGGGGREGREDRDEKGLGSEDRDAFDLGSSDGRSKHGHGVNGGI